MAKFKYRNNAGEFISIYNESEVDSKIHIDYTDDLHFDNMQDYNDKLVEDVSKSLDEQNKKIAELELYKFPNLTIHGKPTIQSGQVSGFSGTNYLEFPFLVDFKSQPFEINFAITTGDDIDNQQNILDSEYGLAFAVRSKKFVMAISYNGTSWAFEKVGSLVLETNKTYEVKVAWNGNVYTVSYSTDGGEIYIEDMTYEGTSQPYPKQMFIGTGKLAENYFTGSINLNKANLKVNDIVVWTGMDDVGISTRLATDLSNLDATGERKIKDISSEGLTDYVKKTDYASSSEAGIIKAGNNLGTNNVGTVYASNRTAAQYDADNNNTFLSKGTLENIKEKAIDENSDDIKIPTAKAVYDLSESKQNKLIAGENITIDDDGTISATSGGTPIQIVRLV